MAQEVLTTLKEHPDSWTRVDTILEYSVNQQTKYYALQILENVIKTRWKVLPRAQCEGKYIYIAFYFTNKIFFFSVWIVSYYLIFVFRHKEIHCGVNHQNIIRCCLTWEGESLCRKTQHDLSPGLLLIRVLLIQNHAYLVFFLIWFSFSRLKFTIFFSPKDFKIWVAKELAFIHQWHRWSQQNKRVIVSKQSSNS